MPRLQPSPGDGVRKDGTACNVEDSDSIMASTLESMSEQQQNLPFLVTHYLAHFQKEHNAAERAFDAEKRKALDKIRQATREIASAFSSLGAYGTAFGVSD